KVGDDTAPFVPLIDGPVVGFDTERSAEPGQSIVTMIVHDDSAYLNQKEEVASYGSKKDSDIAREIFTAAPTASIQTFDIQDTPEPPDALQPLTMKRGTKMTILRALAKRHGDWHAYVLPGPTPGQSIGAFRPFPTLPDGLPAMLLLGDDRNINSFNLKHKGTGPSDVQAATLSIKDKSITTSKSSFRDAQLLGDEPATDNKGDTTSQILPPRQTDAVDLDSAVKGRAASSGYAYEATGAVIPHCYAGVLAPYRVVAVRISDSPLSANYVVSKVTHHLTRSTYTQEFTLLGNAASTAAATSSSSPQPSASAGVSFNVQVGVF
ncbi:MAG TPA: hypothetical protein VE775_07635, partial [Pyrinomonadaceae bacterium]|nr:hypothetical protein [Pyrinomonadaceae bacterium]